MQPSPKLREQQLTRLILIFGILLLLSPGVQAIQVSMITGVNSHSSQEGCCSSAGSRMGIGIAGEISELLETEIHLLAFSTGRWNEANLLLPIYWRGAPTRENPGIDRGETIKYVSRWRVYSSFGLGYFSHATKTKEFQIPILISGGLLTNLNTIRYSFQEKWSLQLSAQFGLGLHRTGTSFSNSIISGFGYEF